MHSTLRATRQVNNIPGQPWTWYGTDSDLELLTLPAPISCRIGIQASAARPGLRAELFRCTYEREHSYLCPCVCLFHLSRCPHSCPPICCEWRFFLLSWVMSSSFIRGISVPVYSIIPGDPRSDTWPLLLRSTWGPAETSGLWFEHPWRCPMENSPPIPGSPSSFLRSPPLTLRQVRLQSLNAPAAFNGVKHTPNTFFPYQQNIFFLFVKICHGYENILLYL